MLMEKEYVILITFVKFFLCHIKLIVYGVFMCQLDAKVIPAEPFMGDTMKITPAC